MAEASVPSIGDLHDDQIVALLRSGAHAALLAAYFGELEYRELAQLAKLAATRRNPRGRRVFVLPGIMGSRLGLVARKSYSLLWLHPTAVANGALRQLAIPGSRSLRAVGVMLPGYLKLRLRLEIAGFRPVFCPFDWRRDVDQLARAFARLIERSGERKALVVGHSMGGLVARKSYSLLWLHPTAVASGSLRQLAIPGSRALRAVGVMLPGYLKLRLRLEIAGFRPVFCPFDWRRDVDQLARAFVRLIERSGERKALVVGHSMGGLVARVALGHDRRRIARLIQLGAPNDGSFAPLQALRAVYPTVRKIAALDRLHTPEQLARAVYHTLPGIYQMLPSELLEPRNWPADELAPDPKLLARARKIRTQLPTASDRCNVIVGVGQETIVSATLSGNGFQYEYRAEGDGTVPTARAQWKDAATWFANENHGALTQNDVVLVAVADILKTGDTRRLRTTAPRAPDVAPRTSTDAELRAVSLRKVQWEALSLDSRRRILEPVISPEFLASSP